MTRQRTLNVRFLSGCVLFFFVLTTTFTAYSAPSTQSAPANAPVFLPAVAYSTEGSDSISGNSTWVSVVDVNGDGKPDILIANWCSSYVYNGCPGGATVGVLVGNGDGTFQPVVTYSTGSYWAFTVLTADVNGDGKPDLLVANGCPVGSNTVCPS